MQRRLGRFYLNRFRKILARQNKSGRFLEIGTGPGYQTAKIADDYPEAEIVGLEPSPDMVRIATAYIADKGLSERVRFVEGAVEDEGLVAGMGTFDLAYSTFSLHHWTDPQRAFRNLYGARLGRHNADIRLREAVVYVLLDTRAAGHAGVDKGCLYQARDNGDAGAARRYDLRARAALPVRGGSSGKIMKRPAPPPP